MLQASSFGLKSGIIAASAISLLVMMPPEKAKAACIGGDSICATFDPATVSNPTNVGGFNGTASVNPGDPFTKAQVFFAITGSSSPGFTLSNISLTGDGITTSLSFGSLNTTGNNTFTTGFLNLNSSLSIIDMINNKISFQIPAGLNVGVQIKAEIQYSSVTGSQVLTSGNDFITTSSNTSVPGPLPLLGAGTAFAYSRRIRRRIQSQPSAQ